MFFKIVDDLEKEETYEDSTACTWEIADSAYEIVEDMPASKIYIFMYINWKCHIDVRHIPKIRLEFPFLTSQRRYLKFEKSKKESSGAFSLRIALTLQIAREYFKLIHRASEVPSLEEVLKAGVNEEYYNISSNEVYHDTIEFALTPGNLDKVNPRLWEDSLEERNPNSFVWEEVKIFMEETW